MDDAGAVYIVSNCKYGDDENYFWMLCVRKTILKLKSR